MSTISMMVDSEMGERPMRLLDAISALPHRRGTPPMERAPESIFTVDDEPELSQNDRDWLDCMTAKGEAALEGALATCLADYRRCKGAGDSSAARDQLRRARGVLNYFLNQ